MKKIGLCVCYDTKNFGSQLQVLATIKAIENLGFQGEIIRYKKRVSFIFICQSMPRFLNPQFLRGKLIEIKHAREVKKHPEIYNNVKIRNKRFQTFVDRYFMKSIKEYIGWKQLKMEAAENYNIFLCEVTSSGCHQIWEAIFTHWNLRQIQRQKLRMQPVLVSAKFHGFRKEEQEIT